MEPVRLTTERLILDSHRRDDFEPFAAMWADPAVLAPMGRPPLAPNESWMRLLQYRGLWPLLGYGYWAIREKATGRFVGDLGFADFHREIEPSIAGMPEGGWALAAWAHGKGLASEALKAALGWIDAQPGFDKTVCLIDPGNAASIRLAERHGYATPVTVEFRGQPTLLFTRPANCNRPRPT